MKVFIFFVECTQAVDQQPAQNIPILCQKKFQFHTFFNLTNKNLHPLSTSLPQPLLPLTICSIQQMENFRESEKKNLNENFQFTRRTTNGMHYECTTTSKCGANEDEGNFCVALLTEKMYLWSECVRRVESTFIGFSQRAFFRTANHEKCFIRWFSLNSPDVSLKLINFFHSWLLPCGFRGWCERQHRWESVNFLNSI